MQPLIVVNKLFLSFVTHLKRSALFVYFLNFCAGQNKICGPARAPHIWWLHSKCKIFFLLEITLKMQKILTAEDCIQNVRNPHNWRLLSKCNISSKLKIAHEIQDLLTAEVCITNTRNSHNWRLHSKCMCSSKLKIALQMQELLIAEDCIPNEGALDNLFAQELSVSLPEQGCIYNSRQTLFYMDFFLQSNDILEVFWPLT